MCPPQLRCPAGSLYTAWSRPGMASHCRLPPSPRIRGRDGVDGLRPAPGGSPGSRRPRRSCWPNWIAREQPYARAVSALAFRTRSHRAHASKPSARFRLHDSRSRRARQAASSTSILIRPPVDNGMKRLAATTRGSRCPTMVHAVGCRKAGGQPWKTLASTYPSSPTLGWDIGDAQARRGPMLERLVRVARRKGGDGCPHRDASLWPAVLEVGPGRIPQRPTRPVPSLLAGLRARRLPRTSQRTRAMPASLLHWCCTDRRGSSRRRRPPSAWVSRCPRSTACARRAPCPASDWAPFGASTSRASSLAATACASSQGPVARGRSRAPRRPASLPDRRVHAESRADAASGCPSGPGCPPQASRRRSPARSAYQRRACLASSRASGWNSSRFIAEPTRELLRRERLDLAGIDLGRPTRDLCVPRRRCSHVFGLVQARQQGCREVRPIARPQPQRLGKHLLLGGHIVSIE